MSARFFGAVILWAALLCSAGSAIAGAPSAFDESDPPDPYAARPDAGLEPAEVDVSTLPVVPVASEPVREIAAPAPMTAPSPDVDPETAVAASPRVSIPAFKALYDVKMKGVVVGELEVSLAKAKGDEWIYRQKSSAKGVAALFGPEDLVETSRFRRRGSRFEVIEYRSKRDGGDADDNARFVFDHGAGRMESVGKGAPWSVDTPEGVVDPLLMTLAMRLDLATQEIGAEGMMPSGAAPSFRFSVPRQGRIKTYEFGVAAVEEMKVDGRAVSTVRVNRLRDKKDQTSIWTAPEMDYLPVRILKTRAEGSSSEVILRSFVRS